MSWKVDHGCPTIHLLFTYKWRSRQLKLWAFLVHLSWKLYTASALIIIRAWRQHPPTVAMFTAKLKVGGGGGLPVWSGSYNQRWVEGLHGFGRWPSMCKSLSWLCEQLRGWVSLLKDQFVNLGFRWQSRPIQDGFNPFQWLAPNVMLHTCFVFLVLPPALSPFLYLVSQLVWNAVSVFLGSSLFCFPPCLPFVDLGVCWQSRPIEDGFNPFQWFAPNVMLHTSFVFLVLPPTLSPFLYLVSQLVWNAVSAFLGSSLLCFPPGLPFVDLGVCWQSRPIEDGFNPFQWFAPNVMLHTCFVFLVLPPTLSPFLYLVSQLVWNAVSAFLGSSLLCFPPGLPFVDLGVCWQSRPIEDGFNPFQWFATQCHAAHMLCVLGLASHLVSLLVPCIPAGLECCVRVPGLLIIVFPTWSPICRSWRLLTIKTYWGWIQPFPMICTQCHAAHMLCVLGLASHLVSLLVPCIPAGLECCVRVPGLLIIVFPTWSPICRSWRLLTIKTYWGWIQPFPMICTQCHAAHMLCVLGLASHLVSLLVHALCSWSCLPPCLPSCTLYPSWSGMLCPRSWAPHYCVSHLVSHLSILAFVDNQDLLRMDSTLSNDLHPMSCCTHALCSWSCLPPCLPSCTLYPSWSGMLCPRSWAPHFCVSHLVSHLVLQQALSSSLFFHSSRSWVWDAVADSLGSLFLLSPPPRNLPWPVVAECWWGNLLFQNAPALEVSGRTTIACYREPQIWGKQHLVYVHEFKGSKGFHRFSLFCSLLSSETDKMIERVSVVSFSSTFPSSHSFRREIHPLPSWFPSIPQAGSDVMMSSWCWAV